MAKATQKIASLGDHRSIPFDRLVLSQANVRRIKRGVSTEELAEDIARRGLLQNLNVRPLLDADGKATGDYEVPAGGRRYQALALLVKAKRLAKKAPIPCNVRAAGSSIPPEEDSLAENTQQVPLHPLDQFRAFKAQVDLGTGIEEVAARFFVTPMVVRQRLRLASVAPALLDLYAEDGISLEQLMAFTVSADHERQLQVWEMMQRSPYRQPYYIRQALTEDSIAATDRRAVFVGIEAYEAAGGAVTRDLFEQDRGGWLDDVALIDRLAAEKLAVEAQAIADEGWKCVEAALDFEYGHTMGLRRLHGRRPEPTEAEQHAHDARVEELDRLYAEHGGEDDVPDGVIERVETLEAAIEAFDDPALVYEPDEIGRAGAFVSLGRDGRVHVDRGFVRPDDEAGNEGAGEGRAEGDPDTGTDVTVGSNPAGDDAEPEDGDALKPLSDRLVTELTAWRTLALRDALAFDPDIAHLAVLHALALAAFYHFGAESCLEIAIKSATFTGQAPSLAGAEPAKAIDARHRFWAELPIAFQNLLFEVFDRLLDTRVEAAVEAGTYDAGVETLRAASLVIADRRTIYTHPGTGAETRVFDILRRDRTEAMPLDDALDLATRPRARLFVNTRSRRAAVAVPAASITLDDGEVEPRVRLVRPTERRNIAASALAGSHWEPADRAAFGAAWDAEIGGLPEFVESRLHIVTGLLLPIWRRLPEDGCCVYRLQTDDGERVIGRRVSPQWVADILQDDRPEITAGDAWSAVLARGGTLQLEGAMTIRRSLVMGMQRVELAGFSDAMVERLKATGLMSEIIAWKLRLFVPTGTDGPSILARLLDRYPIQRVIDRAAA